MMSVKVYFGGLTGEASQGEASFRSLLASQGVGVESEAPVNVKSGYAFANYDSMDAANDAIAKFNGTCIQVKVVSEPERIGVFLTNMELCTCD